MKLHIKEFAGLTGVSVRTLHYYDEVGLLKPAVVDENNGYRYYDEASLLRMQEILFYRELDFSLKSICDILSYPTYDRKAALQEQKELLNLKKERLERLIASIEGAMKGDVVVSAFDNSEFEVYKAEVKERWGNTEAYREYSEKTKGYTQKDYSSLAAEMDDIFAAFALCVRSAAAPDSDEVQLLVQRLQSHISKNYYACTDDILAGLGEMYTADERFRSNIDRHGEGTAVFVSEAIRSCCGR